MREWWSRSSARGTGLEVVVERRCEAARTEAGSRSRALGSEAKLLFLV